MQTVSGSVFAIGMCWGFFWLMAVLLRDYGGVVITLFFSGLGNIVLAVLTVLDILHTWKPLLLIGATLVTYQFLQSVGL